MNNVTAKRQEVFITVLDNIRSTCSQIWKLGLVNFSEKQDVYKTLEPQVY
jgi:hypothetical protein